MALTGKEKKEEWISMISLQNSKISLFGNIFVLDNDFLLNMEKLNSKLPKIYRKILYLIIIIYIIFFY